MPPQNPKANLKPNLKNNSKINLKTHFKANSKVDSKANSKADVPVNFAASIEWPTWLLWGVIWLAWWGLVQGYAALTPWLATPLLVVLLTWYTSFQHELTHGHPTRNATVNRLLGLPPLAIWYPFDTYKTDHLKHHEDAHLTVPGVDTESNYVSAEQAAKMGALALWLCTSQRTALGRIGIGPAIVLVSLLSKVYRQVVTGDFAALRESALHLVLVALLLWWIDTNTAISAWHYCFGIAYPALGLAMLRSLYEHRPGTLPAHRTVINEAGFFWRLLYLNNNYHVVHHAYPTLAWYRIPAAYAADRQGYRLRNQGFVLPGYGWLLRKFAWTPVDSPVLAEPEAALVRTQSPQKRKAAQDFSA
jgi:fatty acid desaturase